MKIDLNAKILDLKDKPLMDGTDEMTLGSVIAVATINTTPDEANMKSDEKVKLFKLALRVTEGGEQDFSLEDAAFLKERVGKMFGPLIVGRVFALLEGEPTKKEGEQDNAPKA